MNRRPLKRYIIIYLTALLAVGMGLVAVISTVAFERIALEEKRDAICQFIESIRFEAMESGDIELPQKAVRHLAPVGFVLVKKENGEDVAEKGNVAMADLADEMAVTARMALGSAQMVMGYFGRTWGVFWHQPQFLIAAARFNSQRQTAAMAVAWDLSEHYRLLRRPLKAIMAYVFINTLILTLVGYYLLWNATGKPISRLVKRAEEFRPEENLFLKSEISENEFDKLSRSLNSMLKRISHDQEMLKETIRSLEIANEELVQAQKDVIRAEKLASAGRLASGVAHEIGNPIGIVLGYLDLLRQNGISKEEKEDFIKRAQKEIQRINTIIRQLLDLSKPSSVTVQTVSVHGIIQDLVEVVRHQPSISNIDMVIETDAGKDAVVANSDQLRQVFLNLILNASDAIGASGVSPGKLIISTEIVSSEQQPFVTQGGEDIVVRFADNGTGMDEDQVGVIFDPFYTTKPPGKGTGLGLSVCFSIVDGIGGSIGIETVLGAGTTMSVRLPLYQSQSDPGDSSENHP